MVGVVGSGRAEQGVLGQHGGVVLHRPGWVLYINMINVHYFCARYRYPKARVLSRQGVIPVCLAKGGGPNRGAVDLDRFVDGRVGGMQHLFVLAPGNNQAAP